MSFFHALYQLIFGPLELLFEVIFTLADHVVHNPGIAIIFLSLAMNFLVLPLYKRADSMQEEQRETEKRLRPWVTHIKKTFHGDERFMMLQTYYRQNNYKPWQVLKGSVSLLLEIPFFIAAYNFLSGLEKLQGVTFGPILDLGAPDGMLVIGSFAINVLPILMTAINIVSGIIYTRGSSLRDKIQVFGMALIFLVLLYQSPAGLVFYWTLNNVFSLAKNIFYKLKNPRLILSIGSSAAGVVLCAVLLIFRPLVSVSGNIAAAFLCCLLELPLAFYFYDHRKNKRTGNDTSKAEPPKKGKLLFFLSTAFLALLTGVLIPSAVIKTSPDEFFLVDKSVPPQLYILNSALLAVGFFVIWLGIYYALANARGKKWMEISAVVLAGMGVTDYMFFGKNYGLLSDKLVFDAAPVIAKRSMLFNAVVLLALAVVLYLVWKKKSQIIEILYAAFVIAVIGMSVFNIHYITKAVSGKEVQVQQEEDEDISLHLNKNGKNVVVLMMDRAINGYLPYIFEEKPELREQFQGFTYFPNTLSYGPCTNIAIPAVFGGYEYTPIEMNRRDTEKLGDKHDESLKVMPVLFEDAGYDVTVSDPTYAGYYWWPDLSIYDEYPGIRAFITKGKYRNTVDLPLMYTEKKLERDFFCYSLFKIAPLCAQPILYDGGNYNGSVNYNGYISQKCESLTVANGLQENFLEPYCVLANLRNITEISDSSENTFLLMTNDTTHEPTMLQTPDYVPAVSVDNTQYVKDHEGVFDLNGRHLHMDSEVQVEHYHVNVSSYVEIGKWLDYLRENDVYDNTRIIIVADHGKTLAQFEDMRFGEDRTEDAMIFNPLLLVKDFNSREFKTDDRFMTNADVPTIATYGLIEDPVNPFTGKKIDSHQKDDPIHYVMFTDYWDTAENNGNTFLPGTWFTVHDDIFNMDEWAHIDENDLPVK